MSGKPMISEEAFRAVLKNQKEPWHIPVDEWLHLMRDYDKRPKHSPLQQRMLDEVFPNEPLPLGEDRPLSVLEWRIELKKRMLKFLEGVVPVPEKATCEHEEVFMDNYEVFMDNYRESPTIDALNALYNYLRKEGK